MAVALLNTAVQVSNDVGLASFGQVNLLNPELVGTLGLRFYIDLLINEQRVDFICHQRN